MGTNQGQAGAEDVTGLVHIGDNRLCRIRMWPYVSSLVTSGNDFRERVWAEAQQRAEAQKMDRKRQ